MRVCEFCEGGLSPLQRVDSKFCSGRCRTAAHRAGRPPRELTSRARWVRWDPSKRPLTVAGRAASSTDPATWSDYQSARDSSAGVGVGFALGDGIGCIDLDDCLTDGVLSPLAEWVLALCPGTWVEVSPSGRGLHVWGWLTLDRGMVRPGVEVYPHGRYMTVTGDRFAGPVKLGSLERAARLIALM